jgi:DNA-binding transcriptional LysR family regulator
LSLAAVRPRLTLLVMELRQLGYFVAVAEELHFTRAAARLLIATPSLSQQIKALERSLSVTLFERSSTGVSLTPAGDLLLPLARATLEAAEEVLSTAHRISAQRATVLRLGFLAFTLTAASRRLLTEFGRTVPNVTVQMRQYEWDDPSGGLLSGATDAALVRPPFTAEDRLHMLELASEPLLAIVAEDHELASAAFVSSARLAQEPWLEAEAATDPVFARFWYFRDLRGQSAPARTRAETLEEWLAEIAFGRGVNVVPSSLAREYRRPGLAFVPVSDAPPSRLVLAWRREDAPEAATTLAAFAARRRSAAD